LVLFFKKEHLDGDCFLKRVSLAAAAFILMAAAPPPVMLPDKVAPVAKPYDETADAHAAVEAAFAAARANGHKVLLDFGGNWCPDCRMLAGVLDLPQVRYWSSQHFETVYIDVGRFKKNADIAAQYGFKLQAAPTVLVVTPDGRVLNRDHFFDLADARSMSPTAVVDLLASWVGS
jgi:thiol-disulfide isomerase/thioredoxin